VSVVKVTCYADNVVTVGKDGKRIESHPNKVETLPDDSPEAQAILNPPKQPDPAPTLEARLAILETAAQLPDGIPRAFAVAKDAAAVVKEASDEQITKPLQVKP
jgi:hypothetical protein